MDLAIEVDRLSRSFRGTNSSVQALTELSFAVPVGEFVALLGVNGAGKTTLTKILSTLLTPSSGSARVLGCDVVSQAKQIRRQQSVIFGGDKGLYGRLSGRDNLRFFAMLQGLGRQALNSQVEQRLDEVGLTAAAERRVETYSKGMRQRLHIAIGLISQPRVLLLDEPTIGLDPVEASRLREAIHSLRQTGVTVLLTSHYLLDVEALADRVILLSRGQIVRDEPLSEFRNSAGFVATVRVTGSGPQPSLADQQGAALECSGDGFEWTMTLSVPEWNSETFAALGARLAGLTVQAIDVQPARLEDSFAAIVQAHG